MLRVYAAHFVIFLLLFDTIYIVRLYCKRRHPFLQGAL